MSSKANHICKSCNKSYILINGCFCVYLNRYVEHAKVPPCTTTNNNKKMNKAYSIIRVCILLIIGCAGTLFLLGEERDNSFFAHLFHLIIDKTLGFLLLALTIILFNKWRKHDWLLQFFDKLCDEADEIQPPMSRQEGEL